MGFGGGGESRWSPGKKPFWLKFTYQNYRKICLNPPPPRPPLDKLNIPRTPPKQWRRQRIKKLGRGGGGLDASKKKGCEGYYVWHEFYLQCEIWFFFRATKWGGVWTHIGRSIVISQQCAILVHTVSNVVHMYMYIAVWFNMDCLSWHCLLLTIKEVELCVTAIFQNYRPLSASALSYIL